MTSILHSKLIIVNGRTFRSHFDQERLGIVRSRHQQHANYTNEDEYGAEGGSDSLAVEQEGEDFTLKLGVDNAILGFLIGAKGATKARVEQQTDAKITITSKTRDASDTAEVLIRARSRQAVISAANRIQLLLGSALAGPKLEYTHFISIPLASAAAQTQFNSFKEEVLSRPTSAEELVEDSIFVDGHKLHLTVAMLKLYTPEKRDKAVQVLESLQPRVNAILGGERLTVALRGLHYTNDDPAAIDVLYLGVENAASGSGLGALQALCSEIVSALDAEGLLLPKDCRDVKLHATLMNSRHRSQREEEAPGLRRPSHHKKRIPFDGRAVLDEFVGIDFGEQTLESLELSVRKARDERTGYYLALSRISLVG